MTNHFSGAWQTSDNCAKDETKDQFAFHVVNEPQLNEFSPQKYLIRNVQNR